MKVQWLHAARGERAPFAAAVTEERKVFCPVGLLSSRGAAMNTELAFSAPTYDHDHYQVLYAGKSVLLRAWAPLATGAVLPRTPAPVPQLFFFFF